MRELANQFGGKNKDFYGSTNEFAKNDKNFPKFAAKINNKLTTIKRLNNQQLNNNEHTQRFPKRDSCRHPR